MSFTGSPGTGKTTVALRMADILHRLGYIEKGHLVSVTRDDLVGQYVGHTAPKTKDVVKRAIGGILFIDEAYYLHRPENERDYGQEAIEVLLQVMESERQNLVVVMAGYEDRMEEFFQANPGMGSRVAHHIAFPDYDVGPADADRRADGRPPGLRAERGRRRRVARLHRAAAGAAPLRPRAQHPQRHRASADAPGHAAVRLDRQAHRKDLVTIEPDDILQSSVFSDTEGEGRMPRPIILGVVGDSGSGQDDHHARARAASWARSR